MKNNKRTTRREFLTLTAKGTAGITLGLAGINEVFSSCNTTKKIVNAGPGTSFTQQPLPYAYDALENVIDKQTMEIHYSKHAATYAKNLVEAAAAEGVDTNKPLEEVLNNISRYSVKMRNNAGGHYNHELFWKLMRPKRTGNKPSGKLLASLEQSFTSFTKFQSTFGDAAKTRFGSGWAWLYADASGNLKIGSTPNQDNPLMNVSEIKGFPILGLDVWEHAYYLKYQNKRAEYVDNWWNVVNWDYVQTRFENVARK